MSEAIGIIGLGRTGMPTAKAYRAEGYEVYGYDVRKEATEELSLAGGNACESAADVARHANVVIIMVLNDEQVLDVVNGENGILRRINRGGVVICMSTIRQSSLKTVAAQCKKKNIGFIDCPFTGGPARINSRSLTLITAGEQDVVEKVRSVLEVIGNIIYVGSTPGQGQAVKHCNQLIVGTTHAATMEVITLAKKMNLDSELVTQVIASGIAGSDYFRLLSESVLKKIPSPGGLGQMCKDMAIVKTTLNDVDMNASVANAASAYFAAAEKLGMQDRQGSALIEVVEQWSEEKSKTS